MSNSSPPRRGIRITVLLICAIGSLVFVSTGLVLFLSGRTALRNTIELLHTQAETTIGRLDGQISTHLRPVEDAVVHVADLVERGIVDPSDPKTFDILLRGALAAAPQVTGMIYWDMGGTGHRLVRDANGVVGDPVVAPAAKDEVLKLLATDMSEVTARWRSPARRDGETYINVVAALRRGDEPLGLIAAGVAVSALSDFVKNAGLEFGATAFILYGTRDVLAHPLLGRPELPQSQTLLRLADLDDPVLHLFHQTLPLERELANGLIVREIETGETRHVILSRETWSFGETVWHIGVHAPVAQVDAQIVRLVLSIVAAIGVLLVSLVAAVFLARAISRPIRTLAGAAERIGSFELDDIARLPRSRITELDEQASAFNRMLDGLRWFETYVPKRLVSRLIADHADRTVAPREVELTVMFTDIIGFTAMSETMAPGDVGAMLNAHFETLSDCIEAEGGTLDKYIGDSVMAFWGAPEDQPDHAERACRAALAIARAVAVPPPGHPRLRLKIALHTGPLLVGNIGASARMNYTVIGDTVNTCSRIETLCGACDDGAPTIILVSDDTMARVNAEAFTFTSAGAFEVKGRREPVRVSRLAVVSSPGNTGDR